MDIKAATKNLRAQIKKAEDDYTAAIRTALPIGTAVEYKRWPEDDPREGIVIGYGFIGSETFYVYVRFHGWEVESCCTDSLTPLPSGYRECSERINTNNNPIILTETETAGAQVGSTG